jgi:hypothetical protein
MAAIYVKMELYSRLKAWEFTGWMNTVAVATMSPMAPNHFPHNISGVNGKSQKFQPRNCITNVRFLKNQRTRQVVKHKKKKRCSIHELYWDQGSTRKLQALRQKE